MLEQRQVSKQENLPYKGLPTEFFRSFLQKLSRLQSFNRITKTAQTCIYHQSEARTAVMIRLDYFRKIKKHETQ